ncbi:zinc-dependent alcohol dehydrogenase family protein [Kribbella sp. CA-253562]|uniref:zinc-dependent alcohol dehydrogenase family protein n=1 Tax=Kribbella sp. CA-253562 TaxID=3239942 RepID=UPI003D94A2BA
MTSEQATVVRFHELGGPEVLRLRREPIGVPGPGEVRLRVDAIGINRAEALFRGGHYIEPVRRFPAGLGAEAAGEIELTGPDVSNLRPGEAVSVVPAFSQNDYPVYADRAIVPAAAVVRRPDGVDAITGSATWMAFLTAYGALVEGGGVRPGDTVLLNAASSSVGLALIQVARHLGVRTIALTRTAAKKPALLDHGADEVIVTSTENVPTRVAALTNARGVRMVLDAVAGPGITDLARLVAPEGTLLVYGALSGEPTPYPGVELGLPALTIRSYTMHETSRDPLRLARAEAFVTAGLRTGAFRPVIAGTFPLEEVVAAHTRLDANAHIGKLVLTVQSGLR